MHLTRLVITTNDPALLLPAWEALGDVAVAPGIEADGTIVLSIDLDAGDDEDDDEAPVHTGRCRECGCTDDQACPGGCWWTGPDLCSACSDTDAPIDPHESPVIAPPGAGSIEEAAAVVNPPPPPATPAHRQPSTLTPFPDPVDLAQTCADAIVAVLEADPDVTFSNGQIADAVGPRFKASTVSFWLQQLAAVGTITRPRRGFYQAAGEP